MGECTTRQGHEQVAASRRCFTTKKCVDETRLDFILQERQETRDRLKQGGTPRN